MTQLLASAQTVLLQPALVSLGLDRLARGQADAVIWDLEDGVPPASKVEARAHVHEALARRHHDSVCRLVRVNDVDSQFHNDDVEMLNDFEITGIVLPKASMRAVEIVSERTRAAVVALVETAQGIADAREIASRPNVVALIFGAYDLSADLGLRPLLNQSELLAYRAEVVLASVLAGLEALFDAPSRHVSDEARLRDDAVRSRSLGFTGKLCASAWQVPYVAAAFRPSDAEIEAARRLVDGGDSQDGVESLARPALLRQALRTLNLGSSDG